MSGLEALLKHCTVKLSLPGQGGWGTGFFVAPGLILTCAHVVKGGKVIQVQWQNQDLTATVEKSCPAPYDIALLRVALAAEANHPCVVLDDDIRSRDPLYLFGYPDEGDRQGEPRTFSCEGVTGGEVAAILFNLGQVRPGMSGSPLLNQRTGKVCGMVKFTRDRASNLGGGAVQAGVILEQFTELRSLQQAFHGGDHRSINLITTQPDIPVQDYLEAVIRHYSRQRDWYTPTDALLLEVRSSEHRERDEQVSQPEKKVEPYPVLVGLRKYALGENHEHLLLVGRPGSGKTTALQQLVVALAEEGKVPVFVRLKGNHPVSKLIQAEFRRMKQRVTLEQIDEWLLNDRLVLLLDGVNEIPHDELRRGLVQFREENLTVPMIFTTRDLSLGIGKRLEMKPLSEPQMREFVGKYLPGQGDCLLGQLRDRLREIAKTPLLLKMLCDIFQKTGEVPQSKGDLFRRFDSEYELFKGLPAVSEDSRRFKSELLRHLAFSMLAGEAREPQLQLTKVEAERRLEAFLDKRVDSPGPAAKEWLEDLWEHHLLQVADDPKQIEFHHQLFLEYYAAEALLEQLPKLDDKQLKQTYLNFRKWTEPLALMLALVEDQMQAERIVRLATEVDLMLAARLAGEVKTKFQVQTVRMIEALDVPNWLKVEFLTQTQSESAIPGLLLKLEDPESSIHCRSAEALVNIGSEEAISGLLKQTKHPDSYVRRSVAEALGKIGSENSIPELLQWLAAEEDADVRENVAEALGTIGSEDAVLGLLQQLQLEDNDNIVNKNAVWALVEIGSEEAIPSLITLIQDKDPDICERAVKALGKLNVKIAIPALFDLLQRTDLLFDNSIIEVLREMCCEMTIRKHLNLAEHTDHFIREGLAEVLGKFKNCSTINVLFKLAEDSNMHVRCAAAQSLGEIGSEVTINRLLQMAEDATPIVRSAVANALSKIMIEEIMITLQGLFQEAEYCELACHRFFQMIENSSLQKIVEIDKIKIEVVMSTLLELCQDSDSSVRENARRELKWIANQSIVPYLLNLLEQPNTNLPWFEIEAILIRSISEPHFSDLINLLQHHSLRVKETAIRILGKIRAEFAIPYFSELIEYSDFFLLTAIVAALTNIGSKAGVPILLGLLNHHEYDLRREIAYALFKIDPEMAIPTLVELLRNPYDFIREEAIYMLGEIGSQEILPNLLNIISEQLCIQADKMKTPYEWIIAVEALTKISPSVAQTEVQKLSQHPNVRTRRNIADILGSVSFDAGGHLLFTLIEDLDYSVKNHAVNSLEKIKSESAIPLLIQLIESHSDSFVRGSAIKALERISKEGSPKIGRFLPGLVSAMIKDSDESVYQIEHLSRVIPEFQRKCGYYNYEIYQAYLANQNGNRSMNQTSDHSATTYHIDKVGNLNTGSVSIHGNQIGEQAP